MPRHQLGGGAGVKVGLFHFLEKFQNVSKTCLEGSKKYIIFFAAIPEDFFALQGKFITIILHPEITALANSLPRR
jgi:hypothetical protein